MLTAGLARRETGVAIYSTYHDSDYIDCVHELGHLLGLRHCSSTSCIMRAGGDSALLKKKKNNKKALSQPQTFCTDCQAKVDVAFVAISS